MIDESAHKVFDYAMENWHGFRAYKCSHCSRQLDIYYCESRLYLVRCKHCKIVVLVEAGNPNEAAEKVSHRAEPENKALTLEQLKQMEGEQVWIPETEAYFSGHGIVNVKEEKVYASDEENDYYSFDEYGAWLAYARPPEEGEKG